MISTNDSLTFFTLHFSTVISLRTSVCDAKLDLVREKCQKSQGGGIVDCSGPYPELKLVMEDLETSDTASPEYPLSHPHPLGIGTSHGRLRNLGYDQFGIPPLPRLLIQDVETTVAPKDTVSFKKHLAKSCMYSNISDKISKNIVWPFPQRQ